MLQNLPLFCSVIDSLHKCISAVLLDCRQIGLTVSSLVLSLAYKVQFYLIS